MGEAIARDTFLVNQGTPLIDANNDLCPGNVGGQVIVFTFHGAADATETTTAYAAVGATNTQITLPKAGSVVGITVNADTDCSTGRCSITAFVGATATTLTCNLVSASLATGGTRENAAYVWDDKDVHTFAAGALLSCQHVNSSLAAAAEHTVCVYVEI